MNKKILLNLKKYLLTSKERTDWNEETPPFRQNTYQTKKQINNIPKATIVHHFPWEHQKVQKLIDNLNRIDSSLPKGMSNNTVYSVENWERPVIRTGEEDFLNSIIDNGIHWIKTKHARHLPMDVAQGIYDYFLYNGEDINKRAIEDIHEEHTGHRGHKLVTKESPSQHIIDFRTKYNIQQHNMFDPNGSGIIARPSLLRSHVVHWLGSHIKDWLKGKGSLVNYISKSLKKENNPYIKDIGSIILSHLAAK